MTCGAPATLRSLPLLSHSPRVLEGSVPGGAAEDGGASLRWLCASSPVRVAG